jgi:hypothetical protein
MCNYLMFKFKCFTIKFQNTLEVGPVSMLNEVLLKFSLKYSQLMKSQK